MIETKMKQNNIPAGWLDIKASEILDVRDGTHDSPKRQTEGVPLITSKNIINGRLNLSEYYCISKSDADLVNKRSKVQRGDILISMIGTVGESALLTDEPNFVVKNVGIFKRNESAVLPKYLINYLRSPYSRKRLMANFNGGIQKFISLGELRKLKLTLPPLPEQKRIVAVLEAWDSYLEKLVKKIEIKKRIKKGLSQQLLTGKKRLKGFIEPWELVTLGSVGDIFTGNTPPMKDKENYGGTHCWATAEDFKSKYINDTRLKLSESGKKLSRWLPAGSILVTCIASIGKNAIAKVPLATNQQINSIVVNQKNSNEFFFYLINNSVKVLRRISGAGAVPILNKTDFSKLKYDAPPSKLEQTAIAEILTKADNEIEALEKKKRVLEAQKKYLLNNLITGAIRTPADLLEGLKND